MKQTLVVLILLASANAWATLGQSVDSVEADRGALQAVRKQANSKSEYTVHTIESGAATVREYVNAAGTVFGLAWTGLTHPDLSQLLGSYASDYQQAVSQNPHEFGKRSHSVDTGSVVVEKWGHMRSMKGRAYDPALLPQGVSADEIK